MRRRAWTPDRIVYDRGERMVLQSPKRDCNRCGTRLGDLTDKELVAASRGRRLPNVHGECPLCLGFHVVFQEPLAPIEPGTDDVFCGTNMLCPGTPEGAAIASCATWTRCGCEPGSEVEVPSSEWVSFLATPCPTSPTGEHRHLVERDEDGTPYVGAPQEKSCAYIDAVWRLGRDNGTFLAEHVLGFATAPGLYPVEIEWFDVDTLLFEPLNIAPHRPAEVAPL